MVHALPRPRLSDLDGKRIVANAGVIALHLLALALLMAPVSWDPPAPAERTSLPTLKVVPEFVRIRPPQPPPPQPQPPRPRTTPTPTPVATPTPITVEPVPMDEGTEPVASVVETGPTPDTFAPADSGEPALATLAYASAPPPAYPRMALRAGQTGTVLLRVQVDASGRPTAVDIERGSGHRLLDQAARQQVLTRWRFHPAMREGRAITAQALVPIEFNLPR